LFIFQVTWSNGEKRDVYKTYEELDEFNAKVPYLLHIFGQVKIIRKK